MNSEDVIEKIHSTKFRFKDYISILLPHTPLPSHSSNILKMEELIKLIKLRETHISQFFFIVIYQ